MTSQTKTKLIIGCFAAVFILIICSVLSFVLFRSQFIGSGKVISEVRDVSEFTKVELNTTADLILIQGDVSGVTIEAEDNVMPRLTASVTDGTLTLATAQAFISISPTKPITFKVTVKNIESVTLNSNGKLSSERMQTKDFKLNIVGSGTVDMDLFADNVTITVNGSGDIKLSGNSNNQNVTINGSGNFDSANMRGRTCTSTINGTGKMTLNCRQELSVHINGSGEVSYYGRPTIKEQDISGSGKIKNLGDAPR